MNNQTDTQATPITHQINTQATCMNNSSVQKDLALERRQRKDRKELITELQAQILRLQALEEKDGPEEDLDDDLILYSDMDLDAKKD
ncbi:hypothetical protein N7528_004291 [Penicillium herquei]|nr:hypothetical protein N7528_004291 [Penicillium herquei]